MMFMKYLLILLLLFSFSSAWALPECEGSPFKERDISKIKHWNNCKGTHIFLNGVKYVGEFKGGLPNGQGTLTYTEGSKYVGEYKDGEGHGQGTFFFSDGRVWEGQFRDSKFIEGKKYAAGEYNEKIQIIGRGSGFLINSTGHLVSNNHVAGVCKKVEAIYNNKILTVDLIANDKVNDLAVAKINTSKKTKHLNISSGSKFGEDIKVYGFPLANRLGSGLKVTKGIVSSLNGPGNNYSLIQIDAAIQPGNSGGPILNSKGNLVGVAVGAINSPIVKGDTITIPQNINFGVKSETLSNFLKANNIKYNSNDKPIAESDNLALQSTVQLNCYNTLREARKLKEQGLVRNILED